MSSIRKDTQEPVDFSTPEEFQSALRSGAVAFTSPQVKLIDPESGSVYTFDVNSPRIYSDTIGLRPLNAAEQKREADKAYADTLKGKAQAASYEFTQGATGVGGVLAAKALDADVERLNTARERNPVLSGGANILGNLASLFTPAAVAKYGVKGGQALVKATAIPRAMASTAAKGGKKVAEKLAPKIGEKAAAVAAATAAGAADAALTISLANASEATLQNKPLTAETAFSNLGPAALLGAATGGGITTGAMLAQATRKKAANIVYKAYTAEQSTGLPAGSLTPEGEAIAKAYGMKGSDILALGAGKDPDQALRTWNRAADHLARITDAGDGKPLILGGITPDEQKSRLFNYVDTTGNDLQAIHGAARESGLGPDHSVADYFNAAKRALGEPGSPGYNKLAKALKQVKADAIDTIRDVPMDANHLGDFLNKIDESSALQKSKKLKDALDSVFSAPESVTFRQIKSDAIESAKTKLSPKDKAKLGSILDEAFDSTAVLSSKKLSDIKYYLAKEAKAFDPTVTTESKAAAAALHKAINEQLESAIQTNASQLIGVDAANFQKLKNAFGLLKSVRDRIKRRDINRQLQADVSLPDRVQQASMVGAAMVGAANGNNPITTISGALLGLGTAAAQRSAVRYGADVLPSLAASEAIERAGIRSAQTQSDHMLTKIFQWSKSNKGKPLEVTSTPKTAGTSGIVAQLIYGPEAKTARGQGMSDPRKVAVASDKLKAAYAAGAIQQSAARNFDVAYGTHMPEVKAAYMQIVDKAVTTLLDAAPPSPAQLPQNVFTPNAEITWTASPIQTVTFLRVAAAIDDPLEEIQKARGGDVNVKALEAVKAVYPAVYDTYLESMIKQLSKSKEPLTISQKSLMDVLTYGTRWQLDQSYVQFIQSNMGAQAPNGTSTRTGAKVTGQQLKALNQSANAMRTQQAKIAEDGE